MPRTQRVSPVVEVVGLAVDLLALSLLLHNGLLVSPPREAALKGVHRSFSPMLSGW